MGAKGSGGRGVEGEGKIVIVAMFSSATWKSKKQYLVSSKCAREPARGFYALLDCNGQWN